MTVLMCTNYPPDEVQKKGQIIVNEGWVCGLQQQLIIEDVCLHVVYPQKESQTPVIHNIKDNYISFGYYELSPKIGKSREIIISQVATYIRKNSFDVIHIMGTEFPHSFFLWQACKEAGVENKVVVSVQGIISRCAEHYLFGIPQRYRHGVTIIEIYNKFSSLNKAKKEFSERGKYEVKLLSTCKQVIGRTDFDRRCIKMINPSVKYFYNSENLRTEFYCSEKWNIEFCDKHSIFLSQATYALKGLHHVLCVLPMIIEHYPDTKLYVAGACPIHKNQWKRNSYARLLSHLIRKGKLQEHVIFCGKLSSKEMHSRYLKSHVFLSASNIENSSNSIAEAMMLGVPTVASAVGGTASILENGREGFTYPLNEPYIMAQEIIEIFENDVLAQELSKNAKIRAEELYNRKNNVKQLLRIYNEIAY